MLKDIQAVIFDLDGSLVDSMWIWKQIDIDYLGRFGYQLPKNLQSEIEGMSFLETALYMQKRFDIPQKVEEMIADWNRMAWDKYENQVFLKPGAAQFLQECKNRNIKLGIASSNSRELVENVIQARGLQGLFGCIMTGSDNVRGKPAPDIYLCAAKGLAVEPKYCLVFEDIVQGILAGKNAGMRVCAVEDTYSAHQREEKRQLADYYIEDYYGLFD